jgi:p-aminobenzoyl-glutamate transporter AbgT
MRTAFYLVVLLTLSLAVMMLGHTPALVAALERDGGQMLASLTPLYSLFDLLIFVALGLFLKAGIGDDETPGA